MLHYIDAEKAFDRVNRTLMLYCLQSNGIKRKLYKNIKEMYTNTNNCVSVNNYLTDTFLSSCGVKQ